MSGVNKVILIGRLGQDPEVKTLNGGNIVATMSLATSENWKDDAGQAHEKTEWHRCVAWNKTAQLIEKYVKKGQQVYVEGKLETRSWDDQQGQKRYTTEIKVTSIQFLGGKGDGGNRPPGPGDQDAPQSDDSKMSSHSIPPSTDADETL